MNGAAAPKISLLSVIVFSLATLPASSVGISLFVYLPPYLAGHIGVGLAMIGFAWATVRGIDLGVDLLLGHMMDRTITPFGRYRVWLAAGVPIFMLAVYMLFMAPVGIGPVYLVGWLFLLYVGNSILLLSQWAWGATLATQYHERSRVFGILTAVGVAAAVITLLIPVFAPYLGLSSDRTVPAMGWFVIVLAPLTVGLSVWLTPERINKDIKTEVFSFADYWQILRNPGVIRLFLAQMALTLGPGWMSAMYLFFFRASRGFTTQQATVLLLLYILAGVAGAPLTARAAMRFGKHRTLIATTTSFSLALFLILLIPKGSFFGMVPVMLWCGFMASGFGLMLNSMMADVGDEFRLAQGKERISVLYALLTLAAKVAAMGAIALTFPLLSWIGFDAREGASNSAAVIHGLEIAFLAGPIVFVMLGGVCVMGWKLDAKRHAGIRAQLDARDAALEQMPVLGDLTGTPHVVLAAGNDPA